MNTPSDKHGLPPRTSDSLGQESMAFGYGLHVAAADFPADAFLSRGNRKPARKSTGIRIKRNTDAHEDRAMNGIETGIDPLNWNFGISFGKPGTYGAMITIGPIYIIFWPVR